MGRRYEDHQHRDVHRGRRLPALDLREGRDGRRRYGLRGVNPGGRKLRNVRATQAIRALLRLGYETVRIRGSHHVLKHPTRGMIVIPLHRGTVKVGILLDAIENAGISVEEFEELL